MTNKESIILNDVEIFPGDIFARQGDVFLRWDGFAASPPAKTTVVKTEKLTVALGEFMGHAHNVLPVGLDGKPEPDMRLEWLQQATQTSPEYLRNFATGNVQVGEELHFITPEHGAVLVHEADGPVTLDNDYHAPVPLPGTSQIAAFRAQERQIDQRARNSAD